MDPATIALLRACGHPDPADASKPLADATLPAAPVTEAELAALIDAVQLPVRDADGRTPLMWAAACGAASIVAQLFYSGCQDVNIADRTHGETALYASAQGGHAEAVSQFIAAGANVDKVTNAKCCTPLFIAAENGHGDVVSKLIAAGASVDKVTNADGCTPLHIAAQNGHGDVV